MSKRLLTIVTWVLALVPLAALALLYGRLPAQVPMHWGVDGAVGYEEKAQLFITAGLPLLLLVMFRVLPKIDPRKRNYQRFQGYYDGFCLVMMVFLLGLNGVILSESLQPGRISVSKVIIIAVGALYLFLGNLMPKVKNNFFMGIRTPWTLSDPDVWNRANRLGGQCFFCMGLIMVAGGLLLPDVINMVLIVAGCIVAGLLPCAMSYFWYQKKQGDQTK